MFYLLCTLMKLCKILNLTEEVNMVYHALPSSRSSSDSGASPATITPCGLFEAECFICERFNCNYIKTFSKLVQ